MTRMKRRAQKMHMRVSVGLVALFALGLLVSGALGDVSPITLSTLTDTTPASTSSPSSTPTDTTPGTSSAATTTTAPTDSSSTSTSTSTATATTPAASQYGTTSTAATTTAATPTGPPVSYIVTFKDGVPDATQQADIVAAGGTPGDAISVLSMYSVTFPAGSDAADAAALAANSDVAAVEQDHSRDTAAIPNDPSYPNQWSLPQIGWDNAYGTVNPGGSATVAILDTGVDASHADLSGAVVAGKNMIDGTSNTADDNGHGTAMAGIVAADTNNGVGIAGVGYAGVKVMPVKVLDSHGLGLDSDVINGVVYATQHGANVILMSFANPGYSSALQSALNYAWSHGVVLVAATGNDSSSTVNYPAGDTGVVGVGSTELGDIPTPSSNTGADVFMAAPGEGILSTSNGGGYNTISGTSASAAAVAGAAALLKASDVTASNGVIVNRLAESADPAGTASQTGNGRLNLQRAVNDTSNASVEPAGAAPNGNGGPYVGPYAIAAQLSGQLQVKENPACSSGGICPWQTANPSNWGELQTVPLRLFFAANQSGLSRTFTIDVTHANGKTQGLDGLFNWSASSNISGITISSGVPTSGVTFLSSTNGGGTTWSYTFTVKINDASAGEIDFFTRLLAGAHQFTGNSMNINGGNGIGTVSFAKPAAAPGNVDLSVTKTALTAVSPGQVLNYSLSYSNAGPSGATNTQLTDVLPAGVTYVNNSCSGACIYDSLSREISWSLGALANGASATKTYQVTVDSSDANNFQFTNNARIFSAETDTNTNNNQSSVTTTVLVPSISGSVVDTSSNGLAGATVTLYNDNNGSLGTQVGSPITTDATGNWSFTGLSTNHTYDVVRTNPSGYTSTSATGGTGTGSTATFISNDRIKVALGGTGTYSSNNTFVASGVHNTSTAVSCLPAPVTYGGNTTCTATVTDTSTSPTTPTGTVTFDNGGASGSFSSTTCTLANPTSSSSSCTVTYTPSAVGTGSHKITGTYGSDSTHNGSSGFQNVTINKATLTVTPDAQSRTYGQAVPTYTFSVVGFQNGETKLTAAGYSAPTCSSSYSPTTPVSASQLTISCTGGSADNYSFDKTATAKLTISPATLTVNAANKSKQYGQPNPDLTYTLSGFVNGENAGAASANVTGAPILTTTATQGSNTGTYAITCNTGTLSAANYSFKCVDGTLTINTLEAPVAYIGQTTFYSSGSSSTTAQVTLSASVVDPTGSTGNVGTATATFTDLLTGKVLASGVKVSPVSSTNVVQGTANTVVTLSTGNYGAQEYVIQVSLAGNYQNCQQTGGPYTAGGTTYCASGPAVSTVAASAYAAAHASVYAMIPPKPYTMQGAASIGTTSPATPAGAYADAANPAYTIGLQYNNKYTNTQGQIQLSFQRTDITGTWTYYVKSNSISSVAFTPPAAGSTQPSKDVTVYTKASIYKVSASGVQIGIDGGVTLRVDAHEGCTTNPTCSDPGGDKIGFTVLSGKDSSLYYSNNWQYDPSILGWRTVQEAVSPFGAVVIN